MKKRKLPIGGIQTFSKLRNNYDVYVDKTAHIFEMATSYEAVLLARPRRFGKSLLCSTIESLFRGERELFEGLYIASKEWEWKEHPVISLELASEDYTIDGTRSLEANIGFQLESVCEEYGIPVNHTDSISVMFARTIRELYKKFGSVVVIIDEYDNPLTSTLDQPEINTQMREKLKAFFSVLKQNDRYLRFVFVTGITKYAQIGMFSGSNQLCDISMLSRYCDICGITYDELEKYFSPEIDTYAKLHGGKASYLNELKRYYDGYYFTGDKVAVFNTFGLLNHFNSNGQFMPFWSMSGHPTLLQKYLEKEDSDIVDVESAIINAGDFADFKDDTITLVPLLYQAGYLTISDYDETLGVYTLKFPNVEVRQTLAKFLSSSYSNTQRKLRDSTSLRLVKSLIEGKPDDFLNLLKPYLARVDYSLSSKITEYYFEFAVSNIVNMLGLECRNEVHTANGRMDSVIFAGEYIYVFEFKVDKPVEDALWQLEEKDYGLIYANSGKKLVEIGVVFSRESRNIVEWSVR